MTSSPTASPPRTLSLNAVDAAIKTYYELVGTGLLIEAWMVRVLLAARDAPPGGRRIDEEGMLHPRTPALAEYVEAIRDPD